ncbi:CaiB/BaiF CoA-transferase family protein [Williamsia sp. D3]|uniref:CaiB/BaiF CoA transferase family protein n=1 Tax=Williamsia sp. D3 TaxID=1313067 RepID=UPI0003D376E7|nr:CoA transferase [Williamsia sp. D3]ETD31348.1 CoA transferase [Williamsia sp. D3]
MGNTAARPLSGIRVLDLVEGLGESCGRYLADLGAEVIRVESPNGSSSRQAPPMIDGVSIPFALRNAGKLGITLDLSAAADRDQLRDLIIDTDILLESARPGTMTDLGLGPDHLATVNPALVYVSITGFGQTGPYRDWIATESTLYALSGVLSRSGAPGGEPLLPPAGLIEGAVGVHAAWSALLAYFRRLETGVGDVVDIAAYEVAVHGFDPGFGTQGSAAAGRSEDYPRGRPDAANFYPVFPCADGHVRICLLAKRQWRGMFEWLGEPAAFADPKYDTIPARFAAADRLGPLIAALFADHTQAELVAEGARRGVPVGGVHTLAEVLTAEHFAQAGSLVDAEIAPDVRATIPSGYVSIDGLRVGFARRAPSLGEHNRALPLVQGLRAEPPATTSRSAAPLAGLRVLDLGVIVFGAELSRQFADNGADVIKVENANYPDGLRQSKRGSALAASVAWGHRNKRSIGLDLRTEDGLALFKRLAAQADVVLANFKPGTLDAMGLSYEDLSAINPRIIVAEGSAFGSSGPWRPRLGYGPLVRASCGVSALWRYPDDAESLCDGSTVYPDHIAAQVSAVAVLATLIERVTSGRGRAIEVAQADTALMQLGVQLVTEALSPGTVTVPGNSNPHAAPAGVYACAGDDEWCVVSVVENSQWPRLCEVIGRSDLASDTALESASGRVKDRYRIDQALGQWISMRSPADVTARMQAAGVPAGMMHRLPDLLEDPQLTARDAYRRLAHELLPAELPAATRVARFRHIPDPPLRQAPLAGQQSRQICAEVLGLDDDDIEKLIASGVLQVAVPLDASVTTRRP